MDYLVNDREEFLKMQQAWKDRVNAGELVTAMHHLFYNILRGKDPKRGFTPITKKKRLENGAHEWESFSMAKNSLGARHPYREPFMFGLSIEEWKEICTHISL